MIGNIGIFILSISFLHLVCSFPPALVDGNKCKSRNGKFPKLGSLCRSYYSCENWIPEETVCPEDQHFFPAKGYCVWPEEYPCLEKPKSKECPLQNGKFLKPETECKVYYDCCKGVSTEKKCAKGLLFDNVRGKCDWPEYVTCLEEPKSKECIRRDGNFLKPGTGCRIFYECRNGISTERRCHADQLFDPDAEKCEWPEIYTCIEEPKSKVCVRPNGKFLRPGTRCRIYYDCRNGVATEKRCPNDLLFDPGEEKCEWPEVYSCVEDISTTKSISQSTSPPTITTPTLASTSAEENEITATSNPISPKTATPDPNEDSSKEGSSSEEENSTGADKQSSTKSRIKFTPPIVSTTANDESTESIEGEVTASSTVSSSTVESSSKAVTSTAAPYDGSTTIAEISTSSSLDEYEIKTSTYPEVITEKTHPEATYTVGNKGSYSSTVTPGLTEPVTFHVFCPKPNGYFPHPYNRHKFIACIEGNPTVMDCPSNLVYDDKRRSCEYDIKN